MKVTTPDTTDASKTIRKPPIATMSETRVV
jgi:hypothetical protein